MTSAASPILLHAERLTAGYGKLAILHDVTLDVRAGEMVSVIGPNGAGKSTAFKTIVGFLRPPADGSSSTARTSRASGRIRCCRAAWPTSRRAASSSPR